MIFIIFVFCPPVCRLHAVHLFGRLLFFSTCVCSPGVVTVTGKCECGQLLVIGRPHQKKKKKGCTQPLLVMYTPSVSMCTWQPLLFSGGLQLPPVRESFPFRFFFSQSSHCWPGLSVTWKWRSLTHWSRRLSRVWKKSIKLRVKQPNTLFCLNLKVAHFTEQQNSCFYKPGIGDWRPLRHCKKKN